MGRETEAYTKLGLRAIKALMHEEANNVLKGYLESFRNNPELVLSKDFTFTTHHFDRLSRALKNIN